MTLVIERAWPYVLAVITTAVWYYWLGQVFPADPLGLLTAAVPAAAVLVGFFTTAYAILLGLVNTDIFKRLARANYIQLFASYFYEAIAAAMAFLIISVVGFFLTGPMGHEAFPLIWTFFATLALYLFVRVNHLLFGLVKHVA